MIVDQYLILLKIFNQFLKLIIIIFSSYLPAQKIRPVAERTTLLKYLSLFNLVKTSLISSNILASTAFILSGLFNCKLITCLAGSITFNLSYFWYSFKVELFE